MGGLPPLGIHSLKVKNPSFRAIGLAYFGAVAGIFSGLTACKTEDINPAAVIVIDSLQNNRIGENGGRAALRATLNGVSTSEIRIAISFSGTAALTPR